MADTGWIWSYHVYGCYCETVAPSYREAAHAIARRHFDVHLHESGAQCSVWLEGAPLSLFITGYRAEGRPSRTGALDVRAPRWDPEIQSARSLGGLALQVYAMLRSDFPIISHLCQREMRWRFSAAAIRDFLANMGAILQALPADQRAALEQRTASLIESYWHAALERNARRRGSRKVEKLARTCKAAAQKKADGGRRLVAYKEGMRTLNLALDGMLPEMDDVVERWVGALTRSTYTQVEARKLSTYARRVTLPRL